MKKIFYCVIYSVCVFCFTSCELFGLDLQKDYEYVHTPGKESLSVNMYQFIESRKDIDMSVLYQAINRVDLKAEYETENRTYIILNDIAFVSYLQAKKFASLSDMSDDKLKDVLLNLIVEGEYPSQTLTDTPLEMKTLNPTMKMFLWLKSPVSSFIVIVHYAANTATGTTVVTSNLKPTNGVAHVVDKYPL